MINPGEENIEKRDMLFNISATDVYSCRVRIYSANSGRLLQTVGVPGRGGGQLCKPVDVCYDGRGHLVVLEEGRVQVFSKKGEFIRAQTLKNNLHAVSSIGEFLFISDSYSVTKFLWKLHN